VPLILSVISKLFLNLLIPCSGFFFVIVTEDSTFFITSTGVEGGRESETFFSSMVSLTGV
jgi:hypothetical protein